MFFEAILAAVLITLTSLSGVFFFGQNKHLHRLERFIVPTAVGVFLSLVLYELIPETVTASADYGGIVIAIGFIGFYILSSILHSHYHEKALDDCDKKGAATLLLVGDSIHNLADGFILGGAFLINPAVGAATALALALHEIPQEIVEFGVLVRAGYTRMQAALRNLISASSVIVGTLFTIAISEHSADYVWVLTGVAAGNLLFLAASDLLPRIHGNLKEYKSVWHPVVAIVIGFVAMTVIISQTHDYVPHTGHDIHEEEHVNDLHDAQSL